MGMQGVDFLSLRLEQHLWSSHLCFDIAIKDANFLESMISHILSFRHLWTTLRGRMSVAVCVLGKQLVSASLIFLDRPCLCKLSIAFDPSWPACTPLACRHS
jgi:hypothetical protein